VNIHHCITCTELITYIVLAGTCVELDPEEKEKLLNERLKQLKQAKRDKQLRDEHMSRLFGSVQWEFVRSIFKDAKDVSLFLQDVEANLHAHPETNQQETTTRITTTTHQIDFLLN
jgi:hypothetical protein